MHVSPSDFRAASRDGIVLHYAVLGPVAYALADFPDGGSRGTFVEEWCVEPHWAVIARGDLDIDLDGERTTIAPGTAFHVPAETRHRLLAPGRARIAAFERIGHSSAASDAALEAAGFEVLATAAPAAPLSGLAVHRPSPEPAPDKGEILATTRRMGDLLFTRARLGRLAGYASDPCDVEHWGVVTSGALAIESEDDIEVLSAGDVFYCPPGPPGHRLQAAEPATVVDFTPIASFRGVRRVAEWRRAHARRALGEGKARRGLQTAAALG
jgi:mannose-6-phosphate isomerase-like protein (cupin superfamily)